jgi:transmembrane sensor
MLDKNCSALPAYGQMRALDTRFNVAHELHHYRKGHLDIADEVADLTACGNFPIQDTDRVLAVLNSALPIRIEQPCAR